MPRTSARVLDVDEHCPADRDVIGGKARSLLGMLDLGLRVPPAFVVTTHACRDFLATGDLDAALVAEIDAAMQRLETRTGRRFGDPTDPLLVSVRSGAATSMPGMMDTILNLGMNPDVQRGLAGITTDSFAEACHVRFLAGFADVVHGVRTDGRLDAAALAAHLTSAGVEIPTDPREQLMAAVRAVFRSWNNDRALAYRDRHGHDHDAGTGVVVQMMVFGNRGPNSGTGVVFSRDPNTGEPGLHGDYLLDAQGDDVVAGTHATLPISALGETLPAIGDELTLAVGRIEQSARDMVDVEFTVDDGVLFFLQSRTGKRAAPAAVRIAVDLVDEGMITIDEALARVTDDQIRFASRPGVAIGGPGPIASGLGACPGVASGEICLSADDALDIADPDTRPVILVRRETSPNDVHGMMASSGVVTALGGSVSHAALVARELDIPTVVGVGELEIDLEAGTVVVGELVLHRGDIVTIDGATGHLYLGTPPTTSAAPGSHLERLRTWQSADAPAAPR
jgi:pyruvate,orthophosphate dikinase